MSKSAQVIRFPGYLRRSEREFWYGCKRYARLEDILYSIPAADFDRLMAWCQRQGRLDLAS